MSAEWFQDQLFPYGEGNTEDGCHPSEAAALKDYLDNKTTTEQAAHAITRYTESLEDPHHNQPVLWALLSNALLQLPESQIQPIIRLLDAIQNLPDPDLAGRETTDARQSLWKSMEHEWANDQKSEWSFGHTWASAQKPEWFKWREQVPDNDPSRSELREKFIRKAEIEARLLSENIRGIDLDWGYECIVEALERSDAVLDFEIPAMEKWITLVGNRLYEGGVHGRQSSALETGDHFGNDYGRTLTLDRWWFWEKRLQEVLHHSQSSLDVKETTHDGELVLRKAASATLREMKFCATNFYKEEGLAKLRQGSMVVSEEVK